MIISNYSQRQYPTPAIIIANPIKHKKEVLSLVKTWRRDFWSSSKNGTPAERFESIASLLTSIATLYNKPLTVKLEADSALGPHYSPLYQTIVIDQKLSIITALHELAHHLFGNNENQASRWSIWLFKKVWPLAFNKLIWNGHLRIKPICQNNPAVQNVEPKSMKSTKKTEK